MSEVVHGLEVQLHDLQRSRLLHEELRHDSHARSYFQNWEVRKCIYGVSNALSNG